ncbi:MAG: hypothetical protein OQK04_18090, partial [Kangiellaceae bacterium]|nr:hypothetical protein [Kangiellaceae bacterium]
MDVSIFTPAEKLIAPVTTGSLGFAKSIPKLIPPPVLPTPENVTSIAGPSTPSGCTQARHRQGWLGRADAGGPRTGCRRARILQELRRSGGRGDAGR